MSVALTYTYVVIIGVTLRFFVFHVVFYGEAAFRHGAVKENSFA